MWFSRNFLYIFFVLQVLKVTSFVTTFPAYNYPEPQFQNLALSEIVDNRAKQQLINRTTDYSSDASENQNINLVTERINQSIVRIDGMSCENSRENQFFRAYIKLSKLRNVPVIENVHNNLCKITTDTNDRYKIEFGKQEFLECGIIDCSNELGVFYCLHLRFPTIPGLWLKNDFQLSLQCKVQQLTASHTKKISFKTLDTSSRTNPNAVTGGYKSFLETDVTLFRKTYQSDNSIFDARIKSGGTVILGEEILLRVSVKEGYGWRYSKISEVTIHSTDKRSRDKIINSLWLLDAEGCVNPALHEICPKEQYKVSPLENYVAFRAFMFDGMKENDEIILNVKVIGCLEGIDCILNCPPSRHNRRARSVKNNSQIVDWLNDIAFRVVMNENKTTFHDFHHALLPYFFFLLLLFCIFLVLFVYSKFLITRKILKINDTNYIKKFELS